MWLILCDPWDQSANWLYQALATRKLAPLYWVNSEQLAASEKQNHWVTGTGAGGTLTIGERTIQSGDLRGVINRLYGIPVVVWRNASTADRDYIQQEVAAFYLSWLHSLQCPVINAATPQGLSGRWRHEAEWVKLALDADLSVAPYCQSTHDGIDEDKGQRRLIRSGLPVRTVIVLGDAVTGQPPPDDQIARACKRLAELAETELLGVDFAIGKSGDWTFVGANSNPDLSVGGWELIDALVSRLTGES